VLGAYHNLIPVWTIGIAHLSLGEPLTVQTIFGARSLLLGTELVVEDRCGPLVLRTQASFA